MGFGPSDCLLYLRLRPAKDISFGVDGEELEHSTEKYLYSLTKIEKVFVADEL